MGGIALPEGVDDAQALQVVLEAAAPRMGGAQAGIERVLPGVAERRVAEVVGERDRLDQVFVQAEFARHRAPELRHLERVRQPGAEQVALVVEEDLGLVDEAPKRGAVDDAVAIALEFVARRRRLLRMAAAPGTPRVAGVGCSAMAVRRSGPRSPRRRGRRAPRAAQRARASMTTKRIAPPSAFLSTRISSR